MTTIDYTDADEFAAVAKIRPIIEQYGPRGEDDRMLAPEIYDAFREHGLLRMWKPKAYGGLETHPITALRVFEEVSAIDGAAGWNLNQQAAGSGAGAFIQSGADEIYADPDAVIAVGFWPPGEAHLTDGGARYSGSFAFASGIDYATWVVNGAALIGPDGPVTDPDTGEPILNAVAFEVASGEIVDTWHTLGMRGTGSKSVTATEVFIPESRIAPVASLPPSSRAEAFANPMFGLVPWLGGLAHAIVPVGIARRSVDEFADLVKSKVPNMHQTMTRDRSTAQAAAGKAQAVLDAARAYLDAATMDALAEDEAGQPLSTDTKIRLQLAQAYAATAAQEAVTLIHNAAGSSSVRTELGFERRFRDVWTITEHVQLQAERYADCGKVRFGVETEWFPFVI